METQTATLETEVNLPDKQAKWLKNGKAIKAGGRYEMISEGTVHKLLIKDAVLDDEAEYTVQIGDASSTATVFVEGRKKFDPCNVTQLLVNGIHREQI